MLLPQPTFRYARVALLAEGVDRNLTQVWRFRVVVSVALLAEGVDRNQYLFAFFVAFPGRPPRGGRG